MTRDRYLYMLLRLKNPGTTQNMPSHRLRDQYFMVGIENQIYSKLSTALLSISSDAANKQQIYKSLLAAEAPWLHNYSDNDELVRKYKKMVKKWT